MLQIPLSMQVIAAITPISIFIITHILLNWKAGKSASLSFMIAAILYLVVFGGNFNLLGISIGKGLAITTFVTLLVFGASLFQNFMDISGNLKIISGKIVQVTGDREMGILLIGWAFSGLIQGIAGMGVPVVIVAPLLILFKLTPLRAVCLALIGHSWAVTWGSLGASFYTIQLVTDVNPDQLKLVLASLGILPIFLTGIGCLLILGGYKTILKKLHLIIIMGIPMSCFHYFSIIFGFEPIASLSAGLAGCITGWIFVQVSKKFTNNATNQIQNEFSNKNSITLKDHKSTQMAFLPYYVLFSMIMLSQIPIIKTFCKKLVFGFNFLGGETNLGHIIQAEENFASISIIHPGLLIITSVFISLLFYRIKSADDLPNIKKLINQSFSELITPLITLSFLLTLSMILRDSGALNIITLQIAPLTGPLFPIVSPFIGMLGVFITGSNQSSNILFGDLQSQIASHLGINNILIIALHSLSSGLNSAVAPAKIILGTAALKISGTETQVLKKTLPFCIIMTLLLGIIGYILK